MRKLKKVSDLVSIYVGVGFSVFVLCGIYIVLDSCVYSKIVLPLFFISALPVVFSLFMFILNIFFKKARRNKITAERILYDNNVYPVYLEATNYFKIALQCKALTRAEILEFKCMLNKALSNNIKQYKTFEFKNDAHEIYTKLKSHHIGAADMEALRDYIMPYAIIASASNLTQQPYKQYKHLKVVK